MSCVACAALQLLISSVDRPPHDQVETTVMININNLSSDISVTSILIRTTDRAEIHVKEKYTCFIYKINTAITQKLPCNQLEMISNNVELYTHLFRCQTVPTLNKIVSKVNVGSQIMKHLQIYKLFISLRQNLGTMYSNFFHLVT